VWRADLALIGQARPPTLSAQERERAERVLSPGRGEVWARSRWVLRQLLGRYLGCDPTEVELEADSAGRLTVTGSREISFSLAHSGSLAVYAFSPRPPVGIDIEAGAALKEATVARRLLDPAELGRVSGLAPPERRREVLRAWVRREALLKCSSAGASDPWLFERDAWPGVACALAVTCGPCPAVSWWDLS